MPEGPEIKQAADKIARALVGETCLEVFFAFEHLKGFESQLCDQEIMSVDAKGKALLITFANQLSIYSHNQLYGKWMICQPGKLAKTGRQLRLAIHNRKKSALLYSASDIEVLEPDQILIHPFLSKLGPDVLDQEVDLQIIKDRITDSRFQRRSIGILLLDQHWLSGLGNYLRSEILFVSQLTPQLKLKDLTPEQVHHFAAAILKLTRQSYKTKGITNDLKTVERLKGEGIKRRFLRHYVFARTGRPCYLCEHPIQKTYIGGRRLYYCESCQGEIS